MHGPDGDIALWVPIVAGLVASLIATPAGISGAFLLLPFQVSVLGIASPSATATNLLFNVVATPGGILGYRRAGRLDGRLAALIACGTLPGVFAGALIRIRYLAQPGAFKLFLGVVLVAFAVKLVVDAARIRRRVLSGPSEPSAWGRPGGIVAMSVVVGVVGGVYGIGGGSLVAPYLVTVAGISIYRVAGAALLATFITSAAGVAVFWAIALITGGPAVGPDWALGLLFGLGGLAGSSIGAHIQHRIPDGAIRAALAAPVAALGLGYVMQGGARLKR